MTRKKARIIDNANETITLTEDDRSAEIRTIYAIFRQIHDSDAHERLMTELKLEFYDTLNIEEFSEDFFECMRSIMVYHDRVKTEVPLLFCIKFVIMCQSKIDNEESLTKNALLLKRLVKYLTSQSDAVDAILRFHSVQAIRILMTELSEDFPVPDTLFEKIQTKLLSRFWDVKTYVRCEAVRASSRLQDPTDAKCPIVIGLMHICKYDSSYTVRLAAIQALAITTKTLPCVVERVRDVNDSVRKKSFDLLAKWKILKPLSISSRLSIIESGLTDKSDNVKNSCKELLKVWLISSENNLVALLKRFDVENMENASEKALLGLLECLSSNEVLVLIDQLRSIMDENNLITEEHLSAESAFLWRNMVSFINERSGDFEGQIERILPTVINFEHYLRRLFEKPIDQSNRKEISLDEYAEYCTIIKNLLPIVNNIDIFDTFNRNLIIDLVKWAMSSVNIPFNYVEHLMKLFVNLESNNLKICDQTVELINELLYTDTDALYNQENIDPDLDREAVNVSRKSNTEALVDTAVNNAESLRKMRMEIAEIDVKINELKENISIGIQNNCLEGLTSMISDLKTLELKKKDFCEMKEKITIPAEEEPIVETLEDNLAVFAAVKKEVDQNQLWMKSGMESRIIKANIMTIAMIKECNLLWTMPSSLRSLLNDVILVSIRHTDTCVREKAILALGLCCLLDKDLALRYYTIFLTSLQVDHDQVKEVAVNSLIDLFIRFGIEPFQEAQWVLACNAMKRESSLTEDGTEETARVPTEEEENRCVSELINPIVALVANDKTELLTSACIGLSKLLYHHKIVSAKLLSRLLLMWFSPQYSDNPLLKAHLGGFFTNYSLMSSDNQQSMASCFLVTMTSLFKASATSPLTEVDIGNVVDFFLRVTDSKYLLDNRLPRGQGHGQATDHDDPLSPHLDNPCHDELGLILANEIVQRPFTGEAKYFVSMLVRLRLSPGKPDVLADIDARVAPMIDKLRDKKSLQLLAKFHNDAQRKMAVPQVAEEPAVVVNTEVSVPVEVPTVPGTPRSRLRNTSISEVIRDMAFEDDDDDDVMDDKRTPPRRRRPVSRSTTKTAIVSKTTTTTTTAKRTAAKKTTTVTAATNVTGDDDPSSPEDSRPRRPQSQPKVTITATPPPQSTTTTTDDDALFKKPMALRATRSTTRKESAPQINNEPTILTRRGSTKKK